MSRGHCGARSSPMTPRRRQKVAALAASLLLGLLGSSTAGALPTGRRLATGIDGRVRAPAAAVPAVARQKFLHNGFHAVTGKSPNTPAAQEGVCNATIPPFATKAGGLRDATLMNYYTTSPWFSRGEWYAREGGCGRGGGGGGSTPLQGGWREGRRYRRWVGGRCLVRLRRGWRGGGKTWASQQSVPSDLQALPGVVPRPCRMPQALTLWVFLGG